MFTVQCPICQKRLEVERLDDPPYLPFCSERCRLIDLGRWLGERYRIPVGPDSADQTDNEETVP